jgi:hypothetical protein
MRNWRLAVLSLGLLGLGGCDRFRKPLCEPANGGHNRRLAIVVKNTAGKCTTETFPQCQHVRRQDVIVWSIVDSSKACNKVTLQFASGVDAVKFDQGKDPNTLQGTVVGKKGRHKYSVLVDGKQTEDPEIEIWP